VGKRVQTTEETHPQNHPGKSGDHSTTRRRPAGCKPGPAPDSESFGRHLEAIVRLCFPELNRWLDALPEPRRLDMCVYAGRHLWWQIILTHLLRGGSRNAFDAERNSGLLPENVLRLCAQDWDEERLGERRTVTCSQNALRQASRVSVREVARIPVLMFRRLLAMRLLESARLFDRWWMIAIDGTLQDRGRATPTQEARYRYVVEAKVVGPPGTMFTLMTEFQDVGDLVRDKEDCELRAFQRLSQRLHDAFPRLPICLLLDGLYPVESVFDRCQSYGWKFIATLREGRQPTAYDEAVQTMMMSPKQTLKVCRQDKEGPVEETFRWTHDVPFGKRAFPVLFSGRITPSAATLWVWVTNLRLDAKRVCAIANQGGRARQGIETVFNVEKNGGFGLEHAFCADNTASQNYHIMMQVAHTLGQLLLNGVLRRLTSACRKLTDIKLVELLWTSLRVVRIDPALPSVGQIRFAPSS
jgi:hypothetical protein